MAAPVDFVLEADDALQTRVEGVSVGVYDPIDYTPMVNMVTGVDGVASTMLEEGIYEVRFYKRGVSFREQVMHVEIEDDSLHVYDVSCHPSELPVAIDPLLCRCTVTLVGLDNRPRPWVTVRIMTAAEEEKLLPRILDSNLISQDTVECKTDGSGRASFDLPRGAELYFMVPRDEDTAKPFKVPDRPSANLIDLVYPRPVAVQWDSTVGTEVTLAVGETVELPFSVILSDLSVITQGHGAWVILSETTSGPTAQELTGTSIKITGLTSGSTQLRLSPRPGLLPKTIPNSLVACPSVTVTVVP